MIVYQNFWYYEKENDWFHNYDDLFFFVYWLWLNWLNSFLFNLMFLFRFPFIFLVNNFIFPFLPIITFLKIKPYDFVFSTNSWQLFFNIDLIQTFFYKSEDIMIEFLSVIEVYEWAHKLSREMMIIVHAVNFHCNNLLNFKSICLVNFKIIIICLY